MITGVAINIEIDSKGNTRVGLGISDLSMSQVNLSGASLKSWLHSLMLVVWWPAMVMPFFRPLKMEGEWDMARAWGL
tara:strand:+ start:593 stop:823 length:231 start_codon:yes stop_codon:yes gene_type:complete